MEKWTLDTQHAQPILTHFCDHAQADNDDHALRQDLGGGYVRCDRCGEKYLPPYEPGNPRYILRLRPSTEAPAT
ncbi:MAG TPA: hypothetical protein VKT77_18965 [Chthonomonadaceae bacterium]|nr:hypothetical protein [Chthonomonadaceae bacterium]